MLSLNALPGVDTTNKNPPGSTRIERSFIQTRNKKNSQMELKASFHVILDSVTLLLFFLLFQLLFSRLLLIITSNVSADCFFSTSQNIIFDQNWSSSMWIFAYTR